MDGDANAPAGGRGKCVVLRCDDNRLILNSVCVKTIKRNGPLMRYVNAAWQRAGSLYRGPHGPFQFSIRFAEPIGVRRVIAVSRIRSDEAALFAYRPPALITRPALISRIVYSEAYPSTADLTLVGERVGKRTWVLQTAYYGPAVLAEPTDRHAARPRGVDRALSLDFWCRHAFVYLPGGEGFISRPQPSSWTKILAGEFPPIEHPHDEAAQGRIMVADAG